jgi:hypothetical protein
VRILFEGYDVIEVPIRATVALPVRAEPTSIDALKHQDGSQATTGVFTVYAADHKPFRVLAVNGRPPVLVDFDPEKDTQRDKYVLRWDLSEYELATCKNAAGERLPIGLVVETDHPAAPMFDLEIRHECNLRQRLSPVTPMDTWSLQDKRVIIGPVKAGESVEVEVEAKWLSQADRAEPPKIMLSESPELFEIKVVSVTPSGDALRVKLKVTVAANARGFIYGQSRLYSNRQTAPLAVIGRVIE